jgi:sugar lactone lactonase YvrE
MNWNVECVLDAKADLGEGPVWDHRTGHLWWVDSTGGSIHRYDPVSGADEQFELGQQVGSVVPCEAGGLIVAAQHGIFHFDASVGSLTEWSNMESDIETNRFNDGKCDPAGRFWAGTMSNDGSGSPSGSLYRIDTDRSITRMVEDITCSNGLSWTADRKTMYYIDTPTRCVFAFDYDVETGAIENRRVAIHLPEDHGNPDGMSIDSEGMLWVAEWEGWRVTRWNPDTVEHLGQIDVPCARVTSCAFAGPNLDQLYITCARRGLDEEKLKQQPLAGGLFLAKPGVTGPEANFFAG